MISYYDNGQVKKERLRDKNGNLYRMIWYYKSGKVDRVYWYENQKLHREDGPAIVYYHENGKVKHEFWYFLDYGVKPFNSTPQAIARIIQIFGRIPQNVRIWAKAHGFTNKQLNTIRKNTLASGMV
jgi:hypothetical protein